jgi:hypothetical protein
MAPVDDPTAPLGERRAAITYGLLLDRVAERLAAATDDLASIQPPSAPPAWQTAHPPTWLVELIRARDAAHQALARNIALLVAPDDPHWSPLVAELRQAATPLPDTTHDPVHADAHERIPHPGTEPVSAVTRVHEAAENLAVAADLLSTHIPLNAPARTPTGWVLRNTTGYAGALATLGGQVPRLHRLDDQLRRVAAPYDLPAAVRSVDQAAWATALADVRLRDHVSNLIYELEAAPPTAWPATATITTGSDARHAIAMVRTWMWQNPTRVQVAHLRACAIVADAAASIPSSQASETTPPPVGRSWQRTRLATRDLRGVAPHADGLAALTTLGNVHTWLTSASSADAAPIAKEFVELAIAMRRAQQDLIRRHDIYIRNRHLRRERVGLITQAATTWRPATSSDEPMRQLAAALRNARTVAQSPLIGPSNETLPALRRPPRQGRRPVSGPAPQPGTLPASPTTPAPPPVAPTSPGPLPAAVRPAPPLPRSRRSR